MTTTGRWGSRPGRALAGLLRLAGAVALVTAASACSEDDTTAPPAAETSDVVVPRSDAPVGPTDLGLGDLGGTCSDECAPIGETRCAEGGVETCGLHDDDGCTEWGAAAPCPERHTCNAGKCGTTCTDACASAGATRCSASGVQTCGDLDSDGCLEWSPGIPCAEGSSCAAGVCTAGCTDDCTVIGTTRCGGDGVESCGQHDVDACLDWSAADPCPPGETCSAGVCSGKCVDECSSPGATLCSGNGTTTCGLHDADPCLDWGAPAPCAVGQSCSGGVCSAGCIDECDTAGALRCAGTGTQLCAQVDADECLEWGAVVSCPAGETCSFGLCSKLCTDECPTPGVRRCTASSVETCGNVDGDACLEWGTPLGCPPGESCSFGSCDAKCQDECAEMGHTACDGGLIQTCGNVDSDACLEWSNGVPCPSPETCAAGVCAAACVDECPADATAACALGAALRCGHFDADPCVEWGPPTLCTAPTTCAFGACVHGCIDECETGSSRCEGAAVRVCAQADADPCLDWGAPAPCASGTCSAGVCGEACVDECDADATECAGPHASRRCGQYDADPCRDWSPASLCGLGASCASGKCAVPPGGPTCFEAVECRASCVGDSGCAQSCALGVTGAAATALSAYDACAASHACTEPLCPVLFCPAEGAACQFPEPGPDACIDALDCLYFCEGSPELCLETCGATASSAGQQQLHQLVGCTSAYCGTDVECADDATDTGGTCSVEFATCLGPDDPGASCRSTASCVADCLEAGEDLETCESTCLPAAHLIGQQEYYALRACSESFDCDGPGCLAVYCAYEHALCQSPGAGLGSCAALVACAEACSSASCDQACWGTADLFQQVVYAARSLCLAGVCPQGDATCTAAALDGPCAGVDATCSGL